MLGPATTIGGFELVVPLGSGGTSEVWRARHVSSGLEVALKCMRTARASDALLVEVQAVARLHHPRIVAVLDFGALTEVESEVTGLEVGTPWVVMELAAGGTLGDAHGALDFARIRAAVDDVLAALAHAHAHGLIHRDIKPGNVLLDERGRARVADFGLAHTSGVADARIAGTPSYMAPEQLAGRWRDYGPATDLYAVGAMGWALTTGMLLGPSSVLPAFAPSLAVPVGWEALLRSLLASDPRHRPTHAADVLNALRDLGPPEEPHPVEQSSGSAGRPVAASATFSLDPAEGDLAAEPYPPPPEPRPGQIAPAPFPPGPPLEPPVRFPISELGISLLPLRTPALVGRVEERRRLWQALESARVGGVPTWVRLEGSSGSGRSRLARWLGARAHELGAAEVVEVPCSASDPVRRVLRRVYGLGALPPDRAAARAEGRAREEGATPVSVAALGAALRDASAVEPGVLVDLVVRLASRRPCVLLLDDADRYSRSDELVRRCLVERAPVCVVQTGPVTGTAGAVTLGPVSPAERVELARVALGLDRALAARLAGSNLRFAVQLARTWAAEGRLVAGPEGFGLREGAGAELSEELARPWEGRLAAVLHGCADEVAWALELAATLAPGSSDPQHREARAHAGLPVRMPALDALARAGIVTRRDGCLELPDELRHVLRERAERDGRSARWHTAAAHALSSLDGPPEQLAEHLFAIGRDADALAPALAGSIRLISTSLSAAEALLRQHQRAAEALGLVDRRALDALHWLAWVAYADGRFDEAKELGTRALEDSAPWPDIAASAHLTLGTVASAEGHASDAIHHLERARAHYVAAGGDTYMDVVETTLADTFRRSGRHDEARAATERLLASPRPRGRAGGYGELANQAALEGRHAAARDATLRAREVLDAAGLPHVSRGTLLLKLGDASRHLGDLEAAEEAYRGALAGADPRDLKAILARANLGLLLTQRRDFEGARVCWDVCIDYAERVGWSRFLGPFLLSAVPCAVGMGEHGVADDLLDRGSRSCEEWGCWEPDAADMVELAAVLWGELGEAERAGRARGVAARHREELRLAREGRAP